ncbi:MAG: TetR/AcrR family transcriptional regulator [Nocardioides sp.]|nr:TetR/AcrR family transcriptional regulator [Nocardioides sp.]
MSGQRPPGDGRGSPERILDAAAGIFAGRGVGGVGMGEIARAARCSRATLYRYFPDRRALHLAFVHRAETAGLADPAERLAAAVLASVRRVREAPALLAWFGAADAATTAELAQSSAVVEALGRGLVDDEDAARWLVRVIVSLLTVPGRDDHDERALVERFVVPAVATTPR